MIAASARLSRRPLGSSRVISILRRLSYRLPACAPTELRHYSGAGGSMLTRYRRISRRTLLALVGIALASSMAGAADAPKRIASFNVCADQLVLALADPDQIVALSPNARDPAISVMTKEAS